MTAAALHTRQHCVYIVSWSLPSHDIIKVGLSNLTSLRYQVFLRNGANLLRLFFLEDDADTPGEEPYVALEQLLLLRIPVDMYGVKPAFSEKSAAARYLGGRGSGYTECYSLQPNSSDELMQLTDKIANGKGFVHRDIDIAQYDLSHRGERPSPALAPVPSLLPVSQTSREKVDMDIRFHIPLQPDGSRAVEPVWPVGWPPPGVGQRVFANDRSAIYTVQEVNWYPGGYEPGGRPVIYVSLW